MRYKSIFQDEESSKYCYLCGKAANHWHHIFNASNKANSERYGLMMRLCWECHSEVHQKRMKEVKKYAQQKAMEKYGLTFDEWRRIFGKNYL